MWCLLLVNGVCKVTDTTLIKPEQTKTFALLYLHCWFLPLSWFWHSLVLISWKYLKQMSARAPPTFQRSGFYWLKGQPRRCIHSGAAACVSPEPSPGVFWLLKGLLSACVTSFAPASCHTIFVSSWSGEGTCSFEKRIYLNL